jgi:hypothetical protein
MIPENLRLSYSVVDLKVFYFSLQLSFDTFFAQMNISELGWICEKKTHLGLYVNHPLLPSVFNQNWNLLASFSGTSQYEIS